MFPSFPSLRERNLITLYGDTKVSGDFTDKDKSPKGSVDYKIRPLVDLINRHPEYVTLSSCSGRVALFDPTGVNVSAYYDGEDKQTQQQQQVKGT
jgi:tRNA(Phe) wybutosine-synthesizing methylase Tyw3